MVALILAGCFSYERNGDDIDEDVDDESGFVTVCSPSEEPVGTTLDLVTVDLAEDCFADEAGFYSFMEPLVAEARADIPAVLDGDGCAGLNARLDSTFDFSTGRVAIVRDGSNLSVRKLTRTESALVVETFSPLSGALAESKAIAVAVPASPTTISVRRCAQTCRGDCEPPP